MVNISCLPVNPMLCERLAGRMGILLKQKEKQEDFVKYLPVFLKQTIDCIYIRFLTLEYSKDFVS